MKSIFLSMKYVSIRRLLLMVVAVSVIAGYGLFVVSAAAPSGGYDPGETLDPDCAPGDADCNVVIPSFWTQTGDDIYFNGGNVGLGDTTPVAWLDLSHDQLVGTIFAIKSVDDPDNNLFAISGFGDITKIKNVTYAWPSSQGSAGTALVNNGSGTLSWGLPYPSQSGNSGKFLYTDGTSVSWSALPGAWARVNSSSARESIFLGTTQNFINDLEGSIFIGDSAGENINNDTWETDFAVLLGYAAGQGASNSFGATFVGYEAGRLAVNAEHSVIIGYEAGENATNATYSTFVGYQAGSGATDAKNSIFIGYQAGLNDTVDNSVSGTSILIGQNTSTGTSCAGIGCSNSIALGTSATNTASNQFMIGSTTSPIDTTRINGSASTQCTITTGTGMACSSDERLKTNITDLSSDTLDKLLNIKTVTYNWKENPNSPTQIGFIAQDLEQYFPELVITDETGYKSVYYSQMTPILVESIREMNLKITALESLTPETSPLFATIRTWLADAGNGIVEVVVGILRADQSYTETLYTDKVCVGSVCITEQQFIDLITESGGTPSGVLPDTEVTDNSGESQLPEETPVAPDQGGETPTPEVSEPVLESSEPENSGETVPETPSETPESEPEPVSDPEPVPEESPAEQAPESETPVTE